MSLVEHLTELRNRLAISLLALAAVLILAVIFRDRVFDFLTEPYCRTDVGRADQCQLANFNVTDQFRAVLHVSLLAAVVGSSPVWLYQLGAFITPALHAHERRWAAGFLAASLSLFALGVTFAYLTIDRGLSFLLEIAGDRVDPILGIRSYLDFVTLTLVAFGVAFEFPVVVLFLNLVGVLPLQRMRAWRRGVIFGIAVFTAVITPSQDPITFLAMAVPLVIMYEGCVLVAAIRARRQRRRDADEGISDLSDDEASPPPPPAAPIMAE